MYSRPIYCCTNIRKWMAQYTVLECKMNIAKEKRVQALNVTRPSPLVFIGSKNNIRRLKPLLVNNSNDSRRLDASWSRKAGWS